MDVFKLNIWQHLDRHSCHKKNQSLRHDVTVILKNMSDFGLLTFMPGLQWIYYIQSLINL